MKTYNGNCHCDNVTFSFSHEEIHSALRCNCSICIRKGAIMTDFVIPPDEFDFKLKEENSLGCYQFDNKVAKHYFCKKCGIFTFVQTLRKPDHYRVNLGCVNDIDTENIHVGMFDGKSI